tara:strand:+ start:440 stop:646 length:207 start_codon:yes stop_codon:yes gene_type:complete
MMQTIAIKPVVNGWNGETMFKPMDKIGKELVSILGKKVNFSKNDIAVLKRNNIVQFIEWKDQGDMPWN